MATSTINKQFDLYHINGVYLNTDLRGGVGYNDITMPTRHAGGIGIILASSGMFAFRINNSGEPVSQTTGLTITNQGDNVFRFTFNAEWYTNIILITTWRYWT